MSNEYRVRARNTATDSENRIHDDRTAARYGFRGGLVPGVTVYGYMTVPVVAAFGRPWLEHGAMQIKFIQPIYEGDEVIVRAATSTPATNTPATDGQRSALSVTAEREDGTVCAVATATLDEPPVAPRLADYPLAGLPAEATRPPAERASFVVGAPLGTLREALDRQAAAWLDKLDERLAVYRGADAVAHPAALLERSNYLLMRNFRLGPWIHAASELVNYSAARPGEVVEARGRVVDCRERKGHEFVVLDILLTAGDARPVQQVRHTAIYRPRFV